MNNTSLLPGGHGLLGRVLNAYGEPIDEKGSLKNTTNLPLSTLEALAQTGNVLAQPLETGIKAIDLLAPLTYGGVVGLIAGPGLGKEVVVEEIMHHLLVGHQGIAVIAGMRETTYDASSLREMVRDIEAENRVAMFFEQTTAELSVHRQLVAAAATAAAHFRAEGREVLLLLDSPLLPIMQIASLRAYSNALGITSLLFAPVDDAHQPADQALLQELDVQIWFSRQRASQGLWPAIDPLATRSRFMESAAVSLEHRQTAQRVREILNRYYTLRESADGTALGETERQIFVRGQRLDLFLSQPFVVAEAFTDVPGAYLTREETIASFRDLLDGRYDDVPVSALQFVGKPPQG